MKSKIIAIAAILFLSLGLNAQVNLGVISGKIMDSDSTTVMPFARVWVETESGLVGTKADLDGKFKIDALKPGVYNLHAKTLEKGEMVVSSVKVDPDGITTVNVYMTNSNMLDPIVIDFNRIKIEKDIPKIKISTEDIENSPFVRSPLELLAGTSSDIKMDEGSSDVIIRGSRPGDAIYYIDGVKMTMMTSFPGVSIGSMEAYTGGIPAKYGDTTGGVIILESKSYFDLYYAWKARQ